jgi:pimeloyl-ACP methyl ester carboxylesterase
MSGVLNRLEPLQHIQAGPLDVAYFEAGPPDGAVTLLLHGYPYDIHTYIDVIPRLATAGKRVIVPYLRGHGETRFLDAVAPRSGEHADIGSDVIALIDALNIPRGRAPCSTTADPPWLGP